MTQLPMLLEERRPAREELIRAELNIEKWPLFTTSQFKGKSREYSRQEVLPTGAIKTRKVVIGRIADKEVGVLRILDLKCYYALIKLWEDAGRPVDRPVVFAIYQIASLLGKSWSGRTLQQIKTSLHKLRKIPIDWINAFYQKDANTYEQLLETFSILAELKLYERREFGRLKAALSSFKFNDRLLRNLLNNHSKPLHLDVVLKVDKEVSILLYQHLDIVMAGRLYYERRSKQLIEEDLDLGGDYCYPSYRKRVLEPALKELEGVKLSTGILSYARLQKIRGTDDWKAVFKKEPLPELSEQARVELQGLVDDILAVTADEHSRGFYTQLARLAVGKPRLHDLIYRCLSEVKDEWHRKLIRTTKGAVFTDKIKRYCQEYGIELGLKSDKRKEG